MSTRREFLEQAAGCLLPMAGKEKDMQDTDQMLLNEVNRLDRAVVQRKQQIEHLSKLLAKKRSSIAEKRPKRYSVEFEFSPNDFVPTPPANEPIQFQAQTRSFVVDGDTTFHCSRIETSVRVVGQTLIPGANLGDPSIPGQVAQVTLPYGFQTAGSTNTHYRQDLFDFTWRVHDTSTDREWQNVEMPSVFLLSGMLQGLDLPVHAVVPGGTEISVEVEPIRIKFDFINTTLFDSMLRYTLHFSLEGHEVRK